MKKRKWLSLLLAVMMLVSAVPFFPVTADAADGTVEVSTWAELKKALDYTTNCSVVKVVKDIETKSLNGHTGLHQDNIIFMTMAMDKVLDLNGHTVNAYAKYYSEVAQGYLINISHKDARLTIRDSVGGGALIGEFNQEFYYEFINVSEGTLVMESGTVKMLCPSKDDQYLKCAIGVSGTAVFNGGEVLTQVTSPGGEREERYLSRRLQAIRGEAGGSVTINGGTFDRVVLHSAPTPENLGKYELVVNGGFFRQSIALILVGDVYASNFDHLPMQINDAYFMRSTDKLDPCRLAISGRLQSFYDRDWDYRLLYNDIPGATFDDALSMMDDLIPHLISENGAVFTDVHDGNWYVRGNMRQWVENGGPIMIFQGTSFGVQGGIAKVISNAYGVKEVLLDGEPMACGQRGFSAPQVDTTAESEHRVTFVMYPISPMLRVLGYSYSNEDSTGYIRMLVDDETGYGIDLTPEPDVVYYDYLSLSVPHPWAGERPIYNNNLVTGLPGGVSVVSYTWYASATGERIQADMTFNAGRRYHVNVILQCEEGYYIADDEELDAYVNGEKAYISAQDGNRTTLTVGYSVPVASGVRGQVTSFMNDGDVTVSLFAGSSTTPKYTVSVPGGIKDSSGKYIAEYEIPDVAAGTYTMTVSKSKHVTREYTVTVNNGKVTQNAEIWLLGDVNGDGFINMTDASQINRKFNGKTSVFDTGDAEIKAYRLKVANVYSSDDNINTTDAAQIKRYYNGKSSVLDTID